MVLKQAAKRIVTDAAMKTKLKSDVLERDIEITNGPDVWLPSGNSRIQAERLSVRYLNLGTGMVKGHWVIASIDVYGQVRSKVTGGLTARSSKVEYDSPETQCPSELWEAAVEHSPGRVWYLTK